MSEVKIQTLIDIYMKRLYELGFTPIEGPNDKSNNATRVDLEHAMWMMERIKDFLKSNDLERAYRWFGFVQGCLWCCGVFTINEMRSYNMEFINAA